MTDHGRTLALTLTDEYLAEVEATLDTLRMHLDGEGEAGLGSWFIEHNESCPAHTRRPASWTHTCACGLEDTLNAIRHALATLRTAREQVRKLTEVA